MGFAEDLETLVVNEGLIVSGVVLKIGRKAIIPTNPGIVILLVETAGPNPDNTHNAAPKPAYDKPGAVVNVRGTDVVAVRTLAHTLYLLFSQRNVEINSNWYRHIWVLQRPYDLGLDDTQRAQYQFNVLGDMSTIP